MSAPTTASKPPPSNDADLPRVFLAIPTGVLKEYCTPQMVAALKNLDYPADKLTVYIAVTHRGADYEDVYVRQVRRLVHYAHIPFPVHVVVVRPTEPEKLRWGQYYAVICNLHALRQRFLDGSWDYFWVLGGDNPPARHMLRGLLRIGQDVSSAIIMQRPNRGRELDPDEGMPPKADPYPMFWVYDWHVRDLERRRDLEPTLKEALLALWVNLPMFRLILTDKTFTVHGASFGSGCSLLTRRVLEHCGYYLTEAGYASEDIMFLQHAHAYGFTTGIDLGLHCAHFDPNGAIY